MRRNRHGQGKKVNSLANSIRQPRESQQIDQTHQHRKYVCCECCCCATLWVLLCDAVYFVCHTNGYFPLENVRCERDVFFLLCSTDILRKLRVRIQHNAVIQCLQRSIIFVGYFDRRTLTAITYMQVLLKMEKHKTKRKEKTKIFISIGFVGLRFSHQLQIVLESNFLEHIGLKYAHGKY